MISKIEGKIEKIADNSVTVVVTPGVFWDIFVPSGILSRLKQTKRKGDELTLYTLEYIEFPSGGGNAYPHLIGFADENDREFFRMFTTVDGVGFKKALKALTKPAKDIAHAIETEDNSVISSLPGFGGRTADKVVAALRGKVAKFALLKESEPLVAEKRKPDEITLENDAVAILQQLGYNEKEGRAMVQKTISESPKVKSPEELINIIFKKGLTGKG
ncbi:MAG: hypothetical protein GF307_03375 [candidate division Zixibacteria bacterium]|nr:hypothetical protein [candidate division Zixibacteria bacterium]